MGGMIEYLAALSAYRRDHPKMELFSVVDDADAIIRLAKGVHKQVKVYQRGGKLFVPHSGGYIRIVPTKWDDSYSTGHPDIKVVEIEGPGITLEGRELRYRRVGVPNLKDVNA